MALSPETHTTHRELELLDTLRALGGSARTATLAAALNVSEETVRRTVKALAKAELVQRVHGGVYMADFEAQTPVQSRLQRNTEEKRRIAQACAQMVREGETVFLDVGSTTAYVAEALRDTRRLTVVTNAFYVAQALVGRSNGAKVFMAGGEVHEIEGGTLGATAARFVKGFNIETAVLSVDAIQPGTGFLLAGFEEAELARVVAEHANRVIVVADSRKFGQSAAVVAFDPEQVDVLITGQSIGAAFSQSLKDWGVQLRVADGSDAPQVQIGT